MGMTSNGMTPCLEFEPDSNLGYVDRYWLMWKLPMYGCTDSSEAIKEIAACKAEYPNAMIKCIGFDATRQMQVAGFLVQKQGLHGRAPVAQYGNSYSYLNSTDY